LSNNTPVTHIAYVLDDSGSMQGLRYKALEVFNRMIADDQAAAVGIVTARVILFTDSDKIREIRAGVLSTVQPILISEFTTHGRNTPLYEAVTGACETLESMPDSKSPTTAFLVKVVTDGGENATRVERKRSFPALLNRLTQTDRWTFTFSCPVNQVGVLQAAGVPRGNIQPWDQSESGMEDMYLSQSVGTQSYFSARAAGQTATRQYFTTDASAVTIKELKKVCNDVSSSFKSIAVQGEVRIDELVRAKKLTFVKGHGFYQLTKPEKVQPGKSLLLREKGKRAIWSGDVRGVLGMPTGVHLKVTPGNHGAYDIFVQSSSDNRKLVRGTTLLYKIA
jgi:hypothetical protein